MMPRILFTCLIVLAVAACTQGNDPAPMAEDDDNPIRYVRNSSFVGPRLEVFVEFDPGYLDESDPGREASVNSLDDAIDTRPAPTPMPGHQARSWTFLKEHEHGTSIAFAVASWDPANPPDYIMAGWWAEFPEQYPPDLDPNQAARIGIVDGPEVDARFPPELPVEGTASYLGPAGGLYRYLPAGGGNEDIVTEEYQGTISIDADFAARTLAGCVGCVGDLVSRRENFRFFLGDEQRFDAGPFIKDYEMHLGTATIEDNGTFGSFDVTVKHPEHKADTLSGFWGGSLSSTPDIEGSPRLAAGFTLGVYEGGDGSRGSFVGSFLALSEGLRRRQ